MIFIALGANLPSARFGPPRATLEAALAALGDMGLDVVRRSRWYESTAVPPSDQPNFVNGVAAVETELGPEDVLARLHAVEAEFGRERRVRWEARVVDLDLIAYDDLVKGRAATQMKELVLPHPRMQERLFVLKPLAEIAPEWRHPVLGKTAAEMMAGLPEGDRVEPLEG
jgi:2-amino-4-hydroxy-6-hydroxymethyldihydropteridine diphosphokinase